MSTADDIVPVILAGGRGMRLRPLTSDTSPKPFLRLFSKYSLFQETVLRVSSFQAPIIVTHHSYLPYVREQLDEIGVIPHSIILEPDHRGTAAAIALAAFSLKNQGKVMLVMPSDHVMAGDAADALRSCVDVALPMVECDVVMVGAKPYRAVTGYGYIVCDPTSELSGVHKVQEFVEKPIYSRAQRLLKNGNSLWNTGILVMRPKIYLNLLKGHDGDVYKYTQRAFYAGEEDAGVYRPAEDEFVKILPISVDYAVMEKCDDGYVVQISAFWCDVGTWAQILRLKMKALFKRIKLTDSDSCHIKKAS